MTATRSSTREAVPFRVRTADGATVELAYSSPRPAEQHDEREVLETLPWFEPGKPLRNYMLHETDFYDEVEQIWGRRWGAEGIGTLREVLVSRPTENEIRPEYAEEWQYYYSSAAGNADLGRLQAQFDEYYAGARGQRRARQLHRAAGAGDRRVRLDQESRHARRRRPRRPRRRDPSPLRARLVAARARGDLGAGARGAAGADLPDDPRQGGLRAGRRPLARLEDVRLQRVGRRERGRATPARVRAVEPRHRAVVATAPAGTTRPATGTSAPRTWTWSC